MDKRVLIVDANHAQPHDRNNGSSNQPFASINAALETAQPGDTIIVKPGIYRERVCPRRGGTPQAPIRLISEQPHKAIIRGSEILKTTWLRDPHHPNIWHAPLAAIPTGETAYRGICDRRVYGDFNPFLLQFNRSKVARPIHAVIAQVREEEAKWLASLNNPPDDSSGTGVAMFEKRLHAVQQQLARLADQKDPFLPRTLARLFVEGTPWRQVEYASLLKQVPGTWLVSADGKELLVHLPKEYSDPHRLTFEIAVRHTVLAPLRRGLGFIHVEGFVLEHAANHFPTWGPEGWPQVGLLSCRSGHHWVICHNIIRHAASIGIDCGSEGGNSKHIERSLDKDGQAHEFRCNMRDPAAGHHLIHDNVICDNGLCGIAGIGHRGTKVVRNIIERNNAGGWTSPWWEFAGIKFHFFYDGLISENLIRDNDCHGIWLDNQWVGSRVSRNLILNNMWSGINMELGRGPVTIDHNIIAHTRHGDGIYGHDVADVRIYHNLIYANANFGVWFAYCTARVKPEDGCHDMKVMNNMILANRAGAIAFPLSFEAGGNNVSNYNRLMGAGEYLDEGSGPRLPLFQFTNVSHTGQMPHITKDFPAQTPQLVRKRFAEAMDRAHIPEEKRPNLNWWVQHYLIPLDIWRELLGNDDASQVLNVTKDGLSALRLEWSFDLPGDPDALKVPVLEGLDADYAGIPYPSEGKVLPGPFQNLKTGPNVCILWPILSSQS
ncbi:MAG: hypothetical protein D6820_10125 [Lentisphaerae bacterium]|nr:MAG: hypothetical protein D6820_10125 [Lentisphaerota bacterium]